MQRCRARRRAQPGGFTLVEILVTIVIIAIGSAVAAVAWSGDPRSDGERDARALAGALEYATARAQARQETLGVSAQAGGGGWRFWLRGDNGQWSPLAGDSVLGARTLGGGFTLQPLAYAGQQVSADSIVPLRASGRNEPFAFVLASGTRQLVVAIDPLNRATITRNAAP